MENGHYTVLRSRASKTPITPGSRWTCFYCPGARAEMLYFKQDGIKRGRVAHVSKFFSAEEVNLLTEVAQFRPIPPAPTRPWLPPAPSPHLD